MRLTVPASLQIRRIMKRPRFSGRHLPEGRSLAFDWPRQGTWSGEPAISCFSKQVVPASGAPSSSSDEWNGGKREWSAFFFTYWARVSSKSSNWSFFVTSFLRRRVNADGRPASIRLRVAGISAVNFQCWDETTHQGWLISKRMGLLEGPTTQYRQRVKEDGGEGNGRENVKRGTTSSRSIILEELVLNLTQPSESEELTQPHEAGAKKRISMRDGWSEGNPLHRRERWRRRAPTLEPNPSSRGEIGAKVLGGELQLEVGHQSLIGLGGGVVRTWFGTGPVMKSTPPWWKRRRRSRRGASGGSVVRWFGGFDWNICLVRRGLRLEAPTERRRLMGCQDKGFVEWGPSIHCALRRRSESHRYQNTPSANPPSAAGVA